MRDNLKVDFPGFENKSEAFTGLRMKCAQRRHSLHAHHWAVNFKQKREARRVWDRACTILWGRNEGR